MRASVAAAAVLIALAGGGAAAADVPQRLSFTVGTDRYEVLAEGLASVRPLREAGLEICPDPAAQAAMTRFTTDHVGDTVTVAIGDTIVTHLQVKTPYAGGCITWPIHPRIAATYAAMLTGAPVATSP